ncbi:extensin [Streptomyces sp. PR69]|uniref:extensin n=1 Tax=Streptomyces sp. PR69 TaxID=2984950 RepID=UPI002264D58E|nr:extensin [Streptomyces sp. PR69]
MKPPAAREAINLLRTMTWVLCAVGLLALVFTTVNVTRFATTRDVPLPIAVLLDPMIGTALAGVIYVDARLASWGIRPPGWSTTLRWGAGFTAALMNTWESLWPDGQIGWPRKADPAAVLLHLTPALLLIALTETIAAYRRTVTDLLDRADPTDRHELVELKSARQGRSTGQELDRGGTRDRSRRRPGSRAQLRAGARVSGRPRYRPPIRTPLNARQPARQPTPCPDAAAPVQGAADGGVWHRAIALDEAARAATSRPVSVWRLRTDLHLGPRRAQQIHAQLLARRPACDDRPVQKRRPRQ